MWVSSFFVEKEFATPRALFYKDIQCGCPFFVKKSFTSGVYYKKLLEKVCTLSKKSLEKVYILSKKSFEKVCYILYNSLEKMNIPLYSIEKR